MYKKKFLAKVVLASALVGGINLLPLPNFEVGNVQISVAYAESKNFSAKDGAMTDVEYIEAQAKEASRLRAIEAVKEKIASYVRNFSGAKGKLTEDDIAAIAEKFEQVGETKYKKLFYNAVDEDGKELGKVGIMYEATVTAKFNSKRITEHIKLTEQEKAKRIRQAREARAKFEELDREYEELRKNARNKTAEQLQSEIKDFDDKISDLEKSRNKNKSAKKDKPKTKQDKIQPMKISNPVEVGKFGWNMRIGGIYIKDATYVSEQPKKTYDTLTYSNGVARFGKGDEALYLHYDMKSQPAFKIGSEDIKNVVPYSFVWSSILKLNVNNGYTMYLIRKDYDIPEPYKQYVLIGRRPDGRWVKYFDIDELSQQYMGKNANVAIQKITAKGDTIIAQYARCNYPKDNNFYASKANEFGEFRFKWDEAAKWFGVEKITYNQKPTAQKPAQKNKTAINQPMKFSNPVEVGQIGFPIQAQIHGLIVSGTSYNDGKARSESYRSRFIVGEVDKTYTKGTARWGDGEDALYCNYDYDGRNIKFGGKNNYVIKTSSTYQRIFKINTNSGITLYNIWLFSGYKNFNIIGRQKDGKWVSYIDCTKIAQTYFGGHIAYKQRGGVDYDEPKFQNDTIIVTYKNYTDLGQMINQGEFRFKWDDKAQWFSVEQIQY